MADVSRDRGRDARPESGDRDDCAENSRRTGWPERGDRPRRDGDRRQADRDGRDRGQLILVTGLAVAVTLVALVLLLNTVIYTQNLATRGTGIEDGEAVGFRGEVVEGVGDVLDAENRQEYDEAGKVRDNVTAGVSRYDALVSRYYAESATVADVEDEGMALTDGSLVHQTNASRNFTNADGDAGDWTLVSDAGDGGSPGVRNATFTVSGENLSDSRSSAFSVRVDDGSNQWDVYLYDSTGTDAVTVAVQNGSESTPHDVCSVSGPEATVDISAGTINGSACPELVWATGVAAPYDVTFRNPTEAIGIYSLTVATPTGSATDVETTNLAGPGEGASPRWAHAVYATEFDVHFQTTDLEFHTMLRVAPGEPE
jgi:hypothetical protein